MCRLCWLHCPPVSTGRFSPPDIFSSFPITSLLSFIPDRGTLRNDLHLPVADEISKTVAPEKPDQLFRLFSGIECIICLEPGPLRKSFLSGEVVIQHRQLCIGRFGMMSAGSERADDQQRTSRPKQSFHFI